MSELPATWTGKKSITLHAEDIEANLLKIDGDLISVLQLNGERYVIMLEDDLLSSYGDSIKEVF
jgi:hypothetical protein